MTPEEKEKELNEKLRELSGPVKYDIGKALYDDGAVLDILRDSRGIDTRVANEMGRFEKVRITLKKNYFSAKCTCRSRGTAICEHSVAAFLQFYKEHPEAVPFPLASPSTSTKTKPVATAPTSGHNGIEGNAKGSSNAIQQMSFANLINELKAVKGHVVLVYKGEGFPAGESRWNNCPFDVEIHYIDKVYSGSNIKRLVETGSAAAGMRFSHFSPQDQQIMRFFSNHGELSGSLYILNAVDMGALFHLLIGFQRFYSGTTKINVNKQIAELVFQVSAKEVKVEIEPRMRVEGYGLLPTHDINVIGARAGFWLGYQGQYWWIPAISGTAWLHSFMKGEKVGMSREDYNGLRDQCTGGLLPVLMIDSSDVGDTEIIAGTFTPILSLDWRNGALQTRLEFSYDGIRISLNSEKMIWTGTKYIMRDEVGEEKIMKKLQKMGFVKFPDSHDTFGMKPLEKIGEFLDVKLPKLSKDWEIYCSTEFERNKNMSGDFKMSVFTTEENNDWFELKYNLFTKPGVSAQWNNVVQAVLSGDHYVRLDSGGVAKITPKIREAIQLNLDNAFEEGEEETLRFSHYNAAYIGSILEDVKIAKAKWHKLCKRVGKSRAGKKPLKLGNELDGILRHYQQDGVTWLNAIEESGFHGILADEMGLGKTIQTLAAIQYSHENSKENRTSLIICPTSLVQNWAVEAKKFIPNFKVGMIYGNNRHNVIKNLSDYDLVITSYALVRRDIETYKHFNFHYVALDEAQHIKNATTANAKTCKEVKAQHRLMLTGTPIENSVREIWSLFDFVMPGYLGTARDFQEKFERKSIEDRQIATQQLADKIRPFMLRRKKIDVCDELPPKIEQVVYCELSDQQQELYDSILIQAKQMLEKIHNEGVQKYRVEMLSVLLRLRQLCCHPQLLPDKVSGGNLAGMPSAKSDLFKELVMESIDSEHRMLVFSQFTGMLGLLRQWLDEEGIKYEYLDGSTTNRMACVDRFNNDETIPIFLLSLKAGGTGLNLTGADTVIHYDQWWNPMVEDQATDRSHRIGQTKQVVAYKLVTKNTVEEKIVQLQDSKRELFNQIMQGVPADINDLTEEDFEFLLSSEDA